MKIRGHYKKSGIALYAMAILLLSVVIFNVNPTVPMIYADKNHDKIKNQSLIAGISDQVVNPSNNKDALQQVPSTNTKPHSSNFRTG